MNRFNRYDELDDTTKIVMNRLINSVASHKGMLMPKTINKILEYAQRHIHQRAKSGKYEKRIF